MSQCIFIPPGPYTMTELSKQLKSGREEGEMKGKTEGARKGERMDLQGSRQKGDSERGKEEKSQERGEERDVWTIQCKTGHRVIKCQYISQKMNSALHSKTWLYRLNH